MIPLSKSIYRILLSFQNVLSCPFSVCTHPEIITLDLFCLFLSLICCFLVQQKFLDLPSYKQFILKNCRLVFHTPLFDYPLICWWMSGFQFGGIINKAARNILVQILLCAYEPVPLSYISRSGVNESQVRHILTIIRN